MEDVARWLKPIVVSVVMFVSLYWIAGSAFTSICGMLIPLVLVLLEISVSFAYGLSGFVFIVAVSLAMVPTSIKHVFFSILLHPLLKIISLRFSFDKNKIMVTISIQTTNNS